MIKTLVWLKVEKALNIIIYYFADSSFQTKSFVGFFFKYILRIYTHNGMSFLIDYLKNAKVSLSRYLCGTPLSFSDGRVGLDKFGLPKIFHYELRELIKSRDTRAIILAYTLLSVSRVLPLSGKPKIENITNNFTGNNLVKNEVINFILTRFASTILRLVWIRRIKPIIRCTSPLPSTKVGPTGFPAAFGILLDTYLLVKYRVNLSSILEFMVLSGNTRLEQYFNNIALRIPSLKPTVPFNETLSRLHYLQDKEGKVRVIAIVDGWTQALLKPLHDFVLRVLKYLETDFTLNQRSGVEYLLSRKMIMIGQGLSPVFHCYDLTAATDRLPVDIQAPLVEKLYGIPGIGLSWQKLIAEREFLLPEGFSIRYSVGQPMGAYSSWAMLALCHHAIVQLAAFYCGFKGFYLNYAIVGDDIVILDSHVAKVYADIMKGLGVIINPIKTYISSEFFEFCKRYNLFGHDVSPLPINLLIVGDRASRIEFERIAISRGFTGIYTPSSRLFSIATFPQVGNTLAHVTHWMELFAPSWFNPSCNHSKENYSHYLLSQFFLAWLAIQYNLCEKATMASESKLHLEVPEKCRELIEWTYSVGLPPQWIIDSLTKSALDNVDLREEIRSLTIEILSGEVVFTQDYLDRILSLSLSTREEFHWSVKEEDAVMHLNDITRMQQFLLTPECELWESLELKGSAIKYYY